MSYTLRFKLCVDIDYAKVRGIEGPDFVKWFNYLAIRFKKKPLNWGIQGLADGRLVAAMARQPDHVTWAERSLLQISSITWQFGSGDIAWATR